MNLKDKLAFGRFVFLAKFQLNKSSFYVTGEMFHRLCLYEPCSISKHFLIKKLLHGSLISC